MYFVGVVFRRAMANSPDDSTATMVASGIVTGLATICVALRFFARLRIKAGIAWDDWFILIGLLTTLLSGSLLLWGLLAVIPQNVIDS